MPIFDEWLSDSSSLKYEWYQCNEEGRDVTGLKEKIDAICAMPAGKAKEAAAGVLLDEMIEVKMKLARDLVADSEDDPSLTYTKADIHRRLVQILGKDEWKRVQKLFPLLCEYWEE